MCSYRLRVLGEQTEINSSNPARVSFCDMFGVGFQMQMRESSLEGTWACQFGFRTAPWPFSLNPNRGTGRGTHAAQAGADAEAHPRCSTRSKC